MMMDELCRKLNYEFKDKELLKVALTHRSSNEQNNERLEFLGDSVVNFIIAEALFRKSPHSQEGELSRWRATLINRETLGNLGREFDLGRYMFFGPGELKSGGNQRESILSCAMEAIIGAIFLDRGFESARESVLQWYDPLLQSLTAAADHKDPKTVLQEYLQSHRKPLPVYTVVSVEGEAHQQVFVVSCQIVDVPEKAIGRGTSRRRAEQDSAEHMLGLIKK